MRIIGVTGGVGAGKSTVLKVLKEEYGAELLMADEIGRELMEPGAACFRPVIEVFGETVIGEDGRLNRGKIAEAVFKDPEALKKLNGIIHPAVRREIERRLSLLRMTEPEKTAVIESAILIEAGYEEICPEIWYVRADKETRIGRLMESRGYSREKCLEVMANQMADEELLARVTAVINNGGSRTSTKEQIASLMAL